MKLFKLLLVMMLVIMPISMIYAQDTTIPETKEVTDTTGVHIVEILTAINEKLGGIKNGVAYSPIDSTIKYTASVKLYEKWGFSADIGYAGFSKDRADEFMAGISYQVINLKKYTSLPILDLIVIDPFIAGAIKKVDLINLGDAEGDFLVGVNLIKVTW